jgi:copper chaperone CopZ
MRTKMCLTVTALALLALSSAARAADPTATTIGIDNMHCQSCAKKIAAKLYAVPGVAAVQANVAARTTTVSPRPQQVLSPRVLWEAVEQAGYHPVRLEGPSGTFTAKPQL